MGEKSIFPLPLVPFEHYMLADDRPDYPMTFWVHLNFQGKFNRESFEEALKVALQRSPILRANVEGSPVDKTSEIYWIEATNPFPAIDWADIETPLHLPKGEAIDLKRETGIRLFVREGEDSTQLYLQFHHACCDGIGAFNFIKDFFTAYTISQAKAISFSPIQQDLLRSRDQYKVNKNKRFLTMLRESYEVLKFLAKPARPLALPLLRNQTVLNFPIHAFHSYLLNALEFEQLKRMAKSLSVTLNDFLLRDLFVALDQWNCRFNPLKRGQSIRICVPVSLHQLQDQKIPVCNALSYVFLERKSNSVKDSSALLQGIHREMKYYKDSELRLSFLKILTLLGGVKKLLAAGIRFRKCYSSVVFSNWGEFWNGIPIFRKNGQMDGMNLRLDHLEVLSPFRPKTYASFAAISCLGKLVISLHYDSKNFSSDDSKLLLSMYIDQIKKSLADNQILTA